MKNKFILFITCIHLFYFSGKSIAQGDIKTEITSVKQNSETIEFTVESEKTFYIGGNVHILHIGNSNFKINKQTKKNGKGSLTFLIPVADYNNLAEGNDIWITYGNPFVIDPNLETDIKILCEKNPHNSWYLGKFSNGLLKK